MYKKSRHFNVHRLVATVAVLSTALVACSARKAPRRPAHAATFGAAPVAPASTNGTVEWVPAAPGTVHIGPTHFPKLYVSGQVIGRAMGDSFVVNVSPFTGEPLSVHALDGCTIVRSSHGAVAALGLDGKRSMLGCVPVSSECPITLEVGLGAYLDAEGSLWVATCQGLNRYAGGFRDMRFDTTGRGIALRLDGTTVVSTDAGASWREVSLPPGTASIDHTSSGLAVVVDDRSFTVLDPTSVKETEAPPHPNHAVDARTSEFEAAARTLPSLRSLHEVKSRRRVETPHGVYALRGSTLELEDATTTATLSRVQMAANCKLYAWGAHAAAVCPTSSTEADVLRLSTDSTLQQVAKESATRNAAWAFSTDGNHYAWSGRCRNGPTQDAPDEAGPSAPAGQKLCLRDISGGTAKEVTIPPREHVQQLQMVGGRLLVHGDEYLVVSSAGELTKPNYAALGDATPVSLAMSSEGRLVGIAKALGDANPVLFEGEPDDLQVIMDVPQHANHVAVNTEGTVFVASAPSVDVWTVDTAHAQLESIWPAGVRLALDEEDDIHGKRPLLSCEGTVCVLGSSLVIRGSPPFAWRNPWLPEEGRCAATR